MFRIPSKPSILSSKGKRPTIHVCDLIVADDMFAL
jgi:hypothetical protein